MGNTDTKQLEGELFDPPEDKYSPMDDALDRLNRLRTSLLSFAKTTADKDSDELLRLTNNVERDIAQYEEDLRRGFPESGTFKEQQDFVDSVLGQITNTAGDKAARGLWDTLWRTAILPIEWNPAAQWVEKKVKENILNLAPKAQVATIDIPQVQSTEEAEVLKPGTLFRDPKGVLRER
jgi:hypothetical protein